jgi:hypothetical protein
VKRRVVSLMLAVFAIGVAVSPVWAADDLTGTWIGQIKDPGHDIVLRLKVEAGKITGTLAGGPPDGSEQSLADARLDGDQLSFKVGPNALEFNGKVTGKLIQGTLESPMGTVDWEVTRK